MDVEISAKKIFMPSDDIVAREIQGEVIIVPLAAGLTDMEDELYTLNETGRAIWKLMDGRRTLQQIIDDLSQEFESEEIGDDVRDFVGELLKKRILIETY